MLNQLLETIIQILTGWVDKFTSHAQHVEDKLDSLDQTASDIETNTEPISDIKDNTGAVITPIQNIKTNTDSIASSSQTSANNSTAILNNISTLSTNTGRAAAFAEDCANNTLEIKNKITTIASDTTQLRADTSELNSMSDKIYEAIKWTLADKYINETESGASPMSFDTDIADDLISCKVGLVAQQSGSGDPSPDNVRPIIGYSSMGLTVNGSAVSIALGDTYYNGLLDVLSGKLKIITAFVKFDGTQSNSDFAFSSGTNKNRIAWNSFQTLGKIGSLNFISDKLRTNANYTGTPDIWSISNSANSVARCFIGVPTTITSVSDWQSYVSSNNIFLVFELNTPIEVQLTAQQIAAIKGVNIITSDTNGDIEVTYKESIKHYLDKQDN